MIVTTLLIENPISSIFEIGVVVEVLRGRRRVVRVIPPPLVHVVVEAVVAELESDTLVF